MSRPAVERRLRGRPASLLDQFDSVIRIFLLFLSPCVPPDQRYNQINAVCYIYHQVIFALLQRRTTASALDIRPVDHRLILTITRARLYLLLTDLLHFKIRLLQYAA